MVLVIIFILLVFFSVFVPLKIIAAVGKIEPKKSTLQQRTEGFNKIKKQTHDNAIATRP